MGIILGMGSANETYYYVTPLLIQRFKIIYSIVGSWDPLAMIFMSPRALGMSPIIDVFIHWKF